MALRCDPSVAADVDERRLARANWYSRTITILARVDTDQLQLEEFDKEDIKIAVKSIKNAL
ncbi:MAG: hypothetical protein HOO99_01670 [Hyphomicrobiaceae bacterium]|nr:hypothetical protein [Hyphomicrobiaceae bacterium]